MTTVLTSIRIEHARYKKLVERALDQVSDAELANDAAAGTNSIGIVCCHLAGYLTSRFTDFMTEDGEKPWRRRDEEFVHRRLARADLLAVWDRGWAVFHDAVGRLSDEDLARTVTIRGQTLPTHLALLRSLAHVSYHAGQVVHMARALRGDDWRCLSVPPVNQLIESADVPSREASSMNAHAPIPRMRRRSVRHRPLAPESC